MEFEKKDVKFTFKLTYNMRRELEWLSETLKIPKGELVRRAVQEYIDKNKEKLRGRG
ncbi:MAG: hypothetical protein DRJ60_00370 [Thermoprotei archaeon]|nr:MAG: hypothetical protein DRJ60_00370 [Thermoprotei archaeon]